MELYLGLGVVLGLVLRFSGRRAARYRLGTRAPSTEYEYRLVGTWYDYDTAWCTLPFTNARPGLRSDDDLCITLPETDVSTPEQGPV
ncbi:hypothetical protein GGS20DRAFT_573696, partial [Poronia punctata]